jgi:Spy/CpxP family protein refolding chaperone
MRNVRKFFLSCLLLLPFCVSTAFAGEGMGINCTNKGEKGQIEKRDKMADKMMSDLKVTPEQKTKLEALRKSHKAKINTFRTQMKEKRDAMKTELAKENYDMTVIEDFKNDLKKIGGSMAAERASVPIEMRKILTTEQFTKLEAKRPKMEKRKEMKKMKGNMPPPMPMEE